MRKIRCLIVDDEALARKLLENYVSKLPELELVGKCESAIQAARILEEEVIDLLFLDIQMPDLSGIDLLKSLSEAPVTIFTTAYSQYALEGYPLDVTDYLLKPIAFERFFQAVQKALEYIQLKQQNPPSLESSPLSHKDYFYIKADYKIIKVKYKDILFIEGLREYVRIHTDSQKIITLLSMARLMEVLPKDSFFRIHRSYIINLDQIQEIQGNLVIIAQEALPVSKSQKEAFFKHIQSLGLF